ncbi:MAG: type II toxin-antitoxin system HicB family antitoxin [Nitrosarchaeum sp.]
MQHSTSTKKTYTVLIEQDEDGLYVAKVPDIVGCHTQGKTVSEVINRIKEAIQACSKDEDIEPLKFIGIQQVQMK